jgi:L-fuculokinase
LKQRVTLIFDIGKTAKKVLLFDARFQVIEEKVEHFGEITDEDGFPSEDLRKVSTWVKEMVDHYLADNRFEITHVNFSAYGASLVHLDESDELVGSFYNYLKPFSERCKQDFLAANNSDGKLLSTTSSPWLGMLNSGLQLFWMKKEKGPQFKKIKTSLHLPQYFAFLLSKNKFCEMTSIGCHTMLWDFQQKKYHPWVEEEHLSNLFPPCKLSTHTWKVTRNGKSFIIGIGVHDSSAALMPYLVTQHEPFLLLSTGTWNITFNPFNHAPLTEAELQKDCLCYLSYEGNPVKASRIFLGHEHEMQVHALMKHFNATSHHITSISFDEKIYSRLSVSFSQGKVVYPVGMEGSGPLPEKPTAKTDWAAFTSLEEAYHQMVRYLVRWQLLSINLINPGNTVQNLIVVGGFTKNVVFLEMLKREAQHLNVFLSDHPRAAALGAAWLVCGEEAYAGNSELLNVIRLNDPVNPAKHP